MVVPDFERPQDGGGALRIVADGRQRKGSRFRESTRLRWLASNRRGGDLSDAFDYGAEEIDLTALPWRSVEDSDGGGVRDPTDPGTTWVLSDGFDSGAEEICHGEARKIPTVRSEPEKRFNGGKGLTESLWAPLIRC
ncbi:hypothetical protein OROGR_001100 [Orobanche gracilis]